MKTTKTIAGHKITLIRGQRYVACRPIAQRGRKAYPVRLRNITHGWNDHDVATIDGLTYDEANALLAAFNNGAISFDGRIW